MNIEKLIKEHHQDMIEKGFYDCPNCIGVKTEDRMVKSMLMNNCSLCHDTRINPEKNMGELLMLIVSEMGEALEAHRNNGFSDWKAFDEFVKGDEIIGFEDCIKDTFEDEIADVFLRLFDLCGYLGIDINPEEKVGNPSKAYDNVGESLYCAQLKLPSLNSYKKEGAYDYFFTFMIGICNKNNIDIEKQITAKREYNKTRPHKHGKEY